MPTRAEREERLAGHIARIKEAVAKLDLAESRRELDGLLFVIKDNAGGARRENDELRHRPSRSLG